MRFYLLTLSVGLFGAIGCGQDTPIDQMPQASWITCVDTADCVARGGQCEDGFCRADNECTSDADCAEGSCVADDNFGGLCATETSGPPVPLPEWACESGADCPIGQGCGSDGLCHEDGECNADADCPEGQLCYNAGNDDPAGFCADERPATNPYCRSDGAGACRYECNLDDSCGTGASCSDGLCYFDDECENEADCTPNHLCEPMFDYGFNVCTEDPDPSCVEAPDGVCRLECQSDLDCVAGGGCDDDNFCHASNECTSDDDCAPGELCYEVELFGGLCGADRP